MTTNQTNQTTEPSHTPATNTFQHLTPEALLNAPTKVANFAQDGELALKYSTIAASDPIPPLPSHKRALKLVETKRMPTTRTTTSNTTTVEPTTRNDTNALSDMRNTMIIMHNDVDTLTKQITKLTDVVIEYHAQTNAVLERQADLITALATRVDKHVTVIRTLRTDICTEIQTSLESIKSQLIDLSTNTGLASYQLNDNTSDFQAPPHTSSLPPSQFSTPQFTNFTSATTMYPKFPVNDPVPRRTDNRNRMDGKANIPGRKMYWDATGDELRAAHNDIQQSVFKHIDRTCIRARCGCKYPTDVTAAMRRNNVQLCIHCNEEFHMDTPLHTAPGVPAERVVTFTDDTDTPIRVNVTEATFYRLRYMQDFVANNKRFVENQIDFMLTHELEPFVTEATTLAGARLEAKAAKMFVYSLAPTYDNRNYTIWSYPINTNGQTHTVALHPIYARAVRHPSSKPDTQPITVPDPITKPSKTTITFNGFDSDEFSDT